MSHLRRVVITGMGVVTPVGNDIPTFWENLVHGRSGIGPITHFDVSRYDCRIAGEVRDFDAVKFFKTPKDLRRTDRFTHLAVGAAKLAMENAGLTTGNDRPAMKLDHTLSPLEARRRFTRTPSLALRHNRAAIYLH